MIILLLSVAEVESLIAGKPDKALQAYLARACRMERDLPDDHLPQAVLLQQVSAEERVYQAVIREFAHAEDAEWAWRHEMEPGPLDAF